MSSDRQRLLKYLRFADFSVFRSETWQKSDVRGRRTAEHVPEGEHDAHGRLRC